MCAKQGQEGKQVIKNIESTFLVLVLCGINDVHGSQGLLEAEEPVRSSQNSVSDLRENIPTPLVRTARRARPMCARVLLRPVVDGEAGVIASGRLTGGEGEPAVPRSSWFARAYRIGEWAHRVLVPQLVIGSTEIFLASYAGLFVATAWRVLLSANLDILSAKQCGSRVHVGVVAFVQGLACAGASILQGLMLGFAAYASHPNNTEYAYSVGIATAIYSATVFLASACVWCDQCRAKKQPAVNSEGESTLKWPADARGNARRLLFDGLGTASGVVGQTIAVMTAGYRGWKAQAIAGALSYGVRTLFHFAHDFFVGKSILTEKFD